MSNAYFGGLKSAIGGIRLDEVARDAITFHDEGEAMKKEETRMKNDGGEAPLLPNKGLYAYRKDGEKHAWNPETISTLQIANSSGQLQEIQRVYPLGR